MEIEKHQLDKIVEAVIAAVPEGEMENPNAVGKAFLQAVETTDYEEGFPFSKIYKDDELKKLFKRVREELPVQPSLPVKTSTVAPPPPPSAQGPTPPPQKAEPVKRKIISYQYKGMPEIDVSEVTEQVTQRYAEILDEQGLATASDAQKNEAMFEAFTLVAPTNVKGGLSAYSQAEWKSLYDVVKSYIDNYGVLTPLTEDPSITEIMVNGPSEIWIENDDGLFKTDLFFSNEDSLRRTLTKIASTVNRRIDEASPILDCRLADGSRVNATLSPPTINGPSLTIRKFPEDSITIDKLIGFGSLTPRAAKFLEYCVDAALNILVIGGTGAGKTTMLNALGNFIPGSARIVTIEDAAELQLQHEHVLKHEARPPNLEGSGEITIGELLKSSLRQRPDRIIVGECRSGEAFDMLQAMNTGHDGSMSTLHANTPKDGISRLNNLVLQAGNDLSEKAINGLIASALDLIVYCGKVPVIDQPGKMRRMVTHITEVQNVEGDGILTQPIFEAKPINGTYYLEPSGLRPNFEQTKFFFNGIQVPDEIYRQDESNVELQRDIEIELSGQRQRWVD